MRVSVIVKNQDKILLIHRIKNGVEFYTIPGGSREEGESPEETAVREAKEETGLEIFIDKKLWSFYRPKDPYGNHEHEVYLAASFTGELQLGEPEASRQTLNNQYLLEWHPYQKLDSITFYPEEIKSKIKELF